MSDSCKQIDAFLSGELDLAAIRDFESHLAECGECSEQVRIAESLDGMIQEAWSVVAVPQSLQPEPKKIALPRDQHERSNLVTGGAFLAVVAVLFLAVAVGFQLFAPEEKPPLANDTPNIAEDVPVDLAAQVANPPVKLLPSSQPTTSILIPEETHSRSFTVLGVHQVVDVIAESQSN